MVNQVRVAAVPAAVVASAASEANADKVDAGAVVDSVAVAEVNAEAEVASIQAQ